jgi:hypothetical protein
MQVQPGDLLVTRVATGEIVSRVEDAGQSRFQKANTDEEISAKTEPVV